MKYKKESPYRYNSPMTFYRRMALYIIDFIVIFALTALIFSLTDFATVKISGTYLNKTETQAQQVREDVFDLYAKAHIGYINTYNDKLFDTYDMSKKYVYSLVYTTLKDGVSDEKMYKDIPYVYNDLGANNDFSFYYFETFKQENKLDYDYDIDTTKTTYTYKDIQEDINNQIITTEVPNNGKEYLGLLMNYKTINNYTAKFPYFVLDESKNLVVDEHGYPKFSSAWALALDDYLCNNHETTNIEGEYYSGKECYKNLYAAYKVFFNAANGDFSTHYTVFVEKTKLISEYRDKLIGYRTAEIVIVYFLVIGLYFMLIPTILKDGRNLSMLIFKGAASTSKGAKISWVNNLIKTLVEFVVFFVVIPLSLSIIYSSNIIFFLQFKLLFPYSMLVIYVISLVAMIVSIAMSAIRKSHQSLPELASDQVVKELRIRRD